MALALPLRLRDGSFLLAEKEEAMLAFARCFFSEWSGALPDDPGFGGRGIPWGNAVALLQPLEPILAEFRHRYGAFLDVRAPRIVETTEAGIIGGRVRSLLITLRSTTGRTITIEV